MHCHGCPLRSSFEPFGPFGWPWWMPSFLQPSFIYCLFGHWPFALRLSLTCKQEKLINFSWLARYWRILKSGKKFVCLWRLFCCRPSSALRARLRWWRGKIQTRGCLQNWAATWVRRNFRNTQILYHETYHRSTVITICRKLIIINYWHI